MVKKLLKIIPFTVQCKTHLCLGMAPLKLPEFHEL